MHSLCTHCVLTMLTFVRQAIQEEYLGTYLLTYVLTYLLTYLPTDLRTYLPVPPGGVRRSSRGPRRPHAQVGTGRDGHAHRLRAA